MLREFMEGQRQIPRSEQLSEIQLQGETIRVFDGTVDFLRDRNSFPNPEVNKIVTLLWRLIANKDIPMSLDLAGQFSSFGLGLARVNSEIRGVFIAPRRFIDMVREDPLMQLGAIVAAASKGRDYYTGRMKYPNIDSGVEPRAYAFEADALLTAQNISSGTLKLNPYQKKVLEDYPEGLASLPVGLQYPTPEYFPGLRQRIN